MQREIRITEDGSTTLYVKSLNEHYHSIHGALAESRHIYIDSAFNFCKKQEVRVLEIGFGTGLNALLTINEAQKQNRRVFYHGVEKYPLNEEEAQLLNYDAILGAAEVSMMELHSKAWEEDCMITPFFTLHKERSDINEIRTKGLFDVIYFDAFAPDVQPEMWIPRIFKKIYDLTAAGGILTTYSVKGDVRRALINAGFDVEKIPGPQSKRQIIRAIKSEL